MMDESYGITDSIKMSDEIEIGVQLVRAERFKQAEAAADLARAECTRLADENDELRAICTELALGADGE